MQFDASAEGAAAGGDTPSKDGVQTPAEPATPPPPPPPATNENMTIKVEDEPEEDPIRAGLEQEVRQRDASISALEKARAEKNQEIANIQVQLEQERLQQMKEALMHKIESERIQRQTQHTEDRLQALEHDMQDKAAIHEYANLIKGVAPKAGADSQYVLKLQAQLQKAVAKMETTNAQMQDLEQHSRQVVDSLSSEIAQLVEDRCRTELELRQQMENLREQKQDVQVQYEERIKENLKILHALRTKAASQISIDELEEELEETATRLEELHRIQETQEKTIAQLNKSLAADAGGEEGM